MNFNKILNKDVSRKKFLGMMGLGIATFVLSAKGVLAKMLFRNNSGDTFEIITTSSPDVTVTIKDVRTVNTGTITRDVDGLITSIVQGDRTITLIRDVNDNVTGWGDTVYDWTLTRDVDNNITEWGVTEK